MKPLIGAILLVVALAGCAPYQLPPAPTVLDEPTRDSAMDDRAEEYCTTHMAGLPLVAAVDATAGTVREIVDELGSRGDWSHDLPDDSAEYVAICVMDVAFVDGLIGDPRFMPTG